MSKYRIKKEDRDLFRQAVGNVRPLVSDKLHLKPGKKPKPRPKPAQADLDANLCNGHHELPAELGFGDTLSYMAPGLQKNALKKLRQGFFEIEAELDLHGLTARDAKRQLLRFLHYCVLDRLHCVHVIHGKGYRSPDGLPVLKNKLNQWLRQHHDVLAFCSSNAADGGTGAIYVLLRLR